MLGLPVREAKPNLDNLMWSLYEQYEKDLKICEPIDPKTLLDSANADYYKETNVPIAVVESGFSRDIYEMDIEHRRKRRVPAELTINMNFALPSNIDMGADPKEVRRILQQIASELSAQVTQQAKEEVLRQSPVEGIQTRSSLPVWRSK
ncbi:MAG: hypothetical protein FJY85_04295 [Deltaproteobacteria bacterium]|nr:hypothetical protein [Deltaproteobacteria bacterium]